MTFGWGPSASIYHELFGCVIEHCRSQYRVPVYSFIDDFAGSACIPPRGYLVDFMRRCGLSTTREMSEGEIETLRASYILLEVTQFYGYFVALERTEDPVTGLYGKCVPFGRRRLTHLGLTALVAAGSFGTVLPLRSNGVPSRKAAKFGGRLTALATELVRCRGSVRGVQRERLRVAVAYSALSRNADTERFRDSERVLAAFKALEYDIIVLCARPCPLCTGRAS